MKNAYLNELLAATLYKFNEEFKNFCYVGPSTALLALSNTIFIAILLNLIKHIQYLHW